MPPQHSATAIPRYVRDAAFDIDRLKLERATMPNGGDAHPVVLYATGESRYDLDAPHPVGDTIHSAREYLRPDHGCPIWELRRLKPIELVRARDAGGDTGYLAAAAMTLGTFGRPKSDAEIETIVDEHGLDEVLGIGRAAMRASEAPKASEKKL
jgi:hypothetical protein